MWRRVVLAMLLAGVGVLAFLVVLVRSQSGGQHLCDVAEATLREISHQRVVIGRCSIDPLTTRVVIEHLEIGPEGRPVLSAQRLTARLDTSRLLGGHVRVDGVEIVRPRVDADLSSPAPPGEVGPRRPQGSACLPDLGHLEVGTVALTEGALSLSLAGGRRLQAEGVGLQVDGHETAMAVEATAVRATLVDPTGEEVVERASLRGEVDLAAGTARVDALDVSTREGALFAQATLTNVCSPRGTVTGTMRLDLARLGDHLLRDVPGLRGQATVRMTAGLDAGRFDANLDVKARGAEAQGMGPLDLDALVSVTPQRATIRSLEVPLPTGRLKAQGAVELSAPFATRLEVQLEHFVMGELLAKLGVGELTTHLEASGTGTLRGPLGGPGGMRLEGTLDAKVPVFGVYDRPWPERARSRQQFVQLEHGTLQGRFLVAPDRLELHQARITGGDTVANVRGVVWFDPRRGLDIAYDFPQLSLADLGPYGPADCRGRGTGAGTATGPYAGLDIRATAALSGIEVMGVELGRASASGRLRLDDLTLEVKEARGVIGRSQWKGGVSMDFRHDSETQGRVELVNAHAADLAATSRTFAAVLGTFDGRLDAVMNGAVDVTGPAARLDAVGSMALTDGLAYGQRFPTGSLTASMLHGDTWRIDALHLVRGAGHVHASGEYRLADQGYSFKVHTKKLTVADLDPLVRAVPGLAGGVTLSAQGSGTLKHPQASARVTLRDWYLGDQPLATARLRLQLDGTHADVEGSLASPWPAGLHPPARQAQAPYPLPPGSMFHELTAKVDLSGDLPFTLALQFDVPDATAVARPGALGDVTAGLAGRLTAEGLVSRPLSVTAALTVDRLWLQRGELRVENSAPARATFAEGRLTLESLPLVGPSFELGAYGTRERDGSLDIAAEGSADLAVLGRLVPAVEDAAGHASFALTLNGTLEAPVVVGNASVDGLTLRPRGVPVEITNGHGGIIFSPTAVVTDGLEASVNGARVAVNGHLELDRFKPQGFEIGLEMGEIPLRFDDVPLVVSGTPLLHGTLDAMTLSGDIEIDRFRFERDLELERTVVQAIELALQRRPPPVPRVFERAGEFLTLDLGLHLGDVRVDNNLLKADLRGDLRATGTNKRPGLVGAVTFNDAKATMRNTEFAISSGVINFTDRSRIRPAFDVRADAQVREYLVHLAASGTAHEPRLLLSSEPALPYADIVTLLTFGVTSRDFDRAGSASLGGFLVDAAYNASGLNDQVKKLLPKNDLLKDASLRVTSAYSELSGNIEPVAQFEGKLHWDNLKLRGQASLIGRGRRAQAEWRFTDSVSGVFQVDSDNPSVPTADYGADFKWHVERP